MVRFARFGLADAPSGPPHTVGRDGYHPTIPPHTVGGTAITPTIPHHTVERDR
jgi:hypothetical protein